MENNTKGHLVNNTVWPKQEVDNSRNIMPQEDLVPYEGLPYDDPAITNPQELASFPPPAEIAPSEEVENENEIRLVNPQRSPVREGRNIISTDNNPDRDGFM